MGYETKMFVVQKSSSDYRDTFTKLPSGEWVHCYEGRQDDYEYNYYYDKADAEMILPKNIIKMHMGWSSVIAMVDLCKIDGTSFLRSLPVTDSYFYDIDGNTPIIVDKYGEMLKEATIEQAIEYMEKENSEEEYRRFTTAIALLKTIPDNYNCVVLFFGH